MSVIETLLLSVSYTKQLADLTARLWSQIAKLARADQRWGAGRHARIRSIPAVLRWWRRNIIMRTRMVLLRPVLNRPLADEAQCCCSFNVWSASVRLSLSKMSKPIPLATPFYVQRCIRLLLNEKLIQG